MKEARKKRHKICLLTHKNLQTLKNSYKSLCELSVNAQNLVTNQKQNENVQI